MRRFIVETTDETLEKNDLEGIIYDSDVGVENYRVVEVKETWESANGKRRMTTKQRDSLWQVCGNYNVEFNEKDYLLDPISGYAEGWIGGSTYRKIEGVQQFGKSTIYVGVGPEGDVNS